MNRFYACAGKLAGAHHSTEASDWLVRVLKGCFILFLVLQIKFYFT